MEDASIELAATYLELNGFFVLRESPVQVAERAGFRTATDIDLLAVRLPHAAELVPARRARARDILLGQDPRLGVAVDRTEVLVAEVKRGRAQLNVPLRDPDVLRFALRRTGCCPLEEIEASATALARAGAIETRSPAGHPCRVRLASFAGEPAPLTLRGAVSLGLADCLAFIRQRLDSYREELRGAYFRQSVLNLIGLIDSLPSPTADRDVGKEKLRAS